MSSKAIASKPLRRLFTGRRAEVSYLSAMRQVLRWRAGVYGRIAAAGLTLRYCVFNVSLLGLAYGASALYLSGAVLADAALPGQFNALTILMAGLSVAFLMHGGAALFFWVFSRGIGGNRLFMPIYLHLGVAAVALVPLAPALACLQAGLRSGGLLLYAAVCALYGGGVLYVAMRRAAALAHWKMALATVAAVIYIGCFIYLWT